jgi:hypothetical protein
VSNQFGAKQVLKVLQPLFLAVPTHKVLGQHQPPRGLDHFKCYQVTGNRIEATVGLRDQFREEPQVRVLDPVVLCNPVEKRHNNNVTPIQNPAEHLVCYQIEGEESEAITVPTRNQFGEETLTLTNPHLLCAPSQKTRIEVDAFSRTVAAIAIDTPLGREVVRLRGPTTVHVMIDDDTGAATDSDGDGRDQVKTEMTQLELRGYSSVGLVSVKLSSTRPTLGEIEETTNNTPDKLDVPPFVTPGSAESFFDVFFEVTIGNRVLHNEQPVRMQTTILHKPPTPVDIYQNPFTQPVPLLDASGAPTGISLVKEIHIPNPPIRISRFPRVRALLVLKTAQDTQQLVLEGSATTHLLMDPSCKAVDVDGDGLDEVQTELGQLELKGTSPSLGPVVLRLRQTISSTGELEETANQVTGRLDVPPCAPRGTANSFFDVFFELQIGTQASRTLEQSGVLHPAGPLQLQATVSNQELLESVTYQSTSTTPVDLLDESDTPSGLQLNPPELSNQNLFLPLIQKPGPQ